MSSIVLNPNEKRAKTALQFAKVMLISIIVMFLAEIYTLYFYHKIPGGTIDYQEAVTFGLIIGLIGLGYIVILILNVIFFIMWFRRAYFNLHKFYYNKMSFSEGWAAGAWFVPFVNLARPFFIAKEMNEKTESLIVKSNLGVYENKRAQTINLWWLFWILSGVIGAVSNQMAKSEDFEWLINSQYIGMASSVLSFLAMIWCIKFIKNYSAMEKLLTNIENVGELDLRPQNSEILDAGI